jgi:ketosteroid isomerase-like protein
MNRTIQIVGIALFVVVSALASAQTADAPPFPFEQWKAAVRSGDAETLKSFYSTDPPAQIEVKRENRSANVDVNFWLGLSARNMKVEVVRLVVHPDRGSIIFKAEVTGADRTVTVTDAQGWRKQGDTWRIVSAERTDDPQLKQPADMKKDIYPANVDAHAEIKEAEERAAKEHKRLLLVFGANWCFDCHVLDLAFQRPDFAPALAGYEVVHIDLGDDGKKNSDVAQEFQTPLDKGIPVLAVAEPDGTVVVSQKNGEFEDARALTPEVLLEFLNKWKAR